MIKLRNLFLVIAAALFMAGCADTLNGPQVAGSHAAAARDFLNRVEPGIRPSARLACTLYLDYAANPKDRADLTKNIWTVSSIVAATTPDVSPGDLSKKIQGALPAGTENKQLADGIAGGWAIALPFVKGDPALLIKVTQDLAGGCADATQ